MYNILGCSSDGKGYCFNCRNLELLITLPGGDSAEGFFLVTLLVELAGAPAVTVKNNFLKGPFIQYEG